jgi:hypothetical protein
MNQKPTLQQKGRYGLQYRGTECTNCGHPLDISDRFCPSCSQANSNKKLTLGDFFNEFFASLISYDSKLLKTLTALLTKPGKITRDYINGKRVSYTNPFRFLLSLAIIYFLALNFSVDWSYGDRFGQGQVDSVYDENGEFSFSLNDDTDTGLFQTKTKKERQNQNQFLKKLDSSTIFNNINKRDSVIMSNPTAHFTKIDSNSMLARFGGKREFFNLLIDKKKVYDFEDINASYKIIESRENKMAFNAALSFSRMKKQPGSFFSSIISKLPFAIFFFLPVFTLFIWLIYIRKKYTYTEHLVFGFHIQSLLFILLIVSFLVDAIFGFFSMPVFLLIFAIYLFLAMWKFYQQGFFKTIVKYVFLNTIFFILALFTIVLLFTGSSFTY